MTNKIVETLLRASALLEARDLGRRSVKKFYVVIPFSEQYGKKELSDLSKGVLDGVLGISERHQIIMQWYGVGRDAILVMDADKLVKDNQLSRVQYDNPEYLASNGMAALYRIFDKQRGTSNGRSGLAQNLVDHMLIATKTGKKPGADVLDAAKVLAASIRKHADDLSKALKALPFDDKGDLRSALRSVTDNQMDADDFESFLKYRADKAVEDLTEFSTSYNGLGEQLIRLYLDRDHMEADSSAREAAALATKAEAAAIDYGWEANQVEALMDVMAKFAVLVKDFDAVQALKKKAVSEVGSMSGDSAISYALGYDRGRALEKDFNDNSTDDIKTVKGLAKRVHDVFSKSGGRNYADISLASWERVVRKALKSIGNTYADEGEWLVKDKKLRIPVGSTLFVTSDDKLPPEVEERRQAGTLTMRDEMAHSSALKYAGQYDQMIKKYNLDKRYKVQRIDKAKFDKARSLYLTSPKKAVVSALLAAATALSANEIFTDESGKFWGNQGAGGVFLAEDTGRILIQKRSPHVNEPNTWGSWGGAVDAGEDPKQAMRREIEEESGYDGPKKIEPLFTFESGNFRFYNFLIRVPREFTPILSWESSDYLWTTVDDIPAPMHFGLKALLPHLKRKA